MRSSRAPRPTASAFASLALALAGALCAAACATTSAVAPKAPARAPAAAVGSVAAQAPTTAHVPKTAQAPSPAQPPAAAEAPAAASAGAPARAAAPIGAPSNVPAVEQTVSKAEPAAPVAPASTPGVAPSTPAEATVALVLPLESPDYARVAAAVRDGFLAAAGAANATDRCRVIGHGDQGVLGAFEAARSMGAAVVVGPLLRDDLRALAAASAPLPVTLALNQLDDAATLPPQVYTLALSVEGDARPLAQRMRVNGATSVVVIGNDTPISRRFAAAFGGEWLLAGGGPVESVRFDPRPDGLTALRGALSRSTASAAVLALDGQDAAIARNFALRIPVYGLSLVNQSHAPAVLADLEGLQFVEIPWLARPDDRAFARMPRRAMGNTVLDRLYALGLDAFAVAQALVHGAPERLDIDGATGRLTLSGGRHVERDGVLAVFRGGQVVPADAAR